MGISTFTSPQSKGLSSLFILLLLNTSFLFLLPFFLTTTTTAAATSSSSSGDCSSLSQFPDHKSKCSYINSHTSCQSTGGYINYTQIFYCNFPQFPQLGHSLLLLWLLILFYLLANTASDYFCPSLESLSTALHLPPTIAGTTLLPLGNGATDVFSSIVSFTSGGGGGSGDVGLNSILGGVFFVSSIVVGIISILISSRRIAVDKPSFVRDTLFLLLSLSLLLLIAISGQITLWVATSFVSAYFLYIALVCAMHFYYRQGAEAEQQQKNKCPDEMKAPLLDCVVVDCVVDDDDDVDDSSNLASSWSRFVWLVRLFELPLYLPRRLTIPMISEEKWSKPFAVVSVTLAPNLIALLWNTQNKDMGPKTRALIYITSGVIGVCLGNLAFVATKATAPPKRCLFPWLVGGFVMSITWTYVIAEELVSLLVSLGTIFGISPSILGLTVLAWGNSIGDLISNAALAMNGGPDGAQIAISGCYAGPLFNTLVGLGSSLVFASWSVYPNPYKVPKDPYLYETLGFLMGGLLWALVVLPRREMRVDRFLGSGLLVIYLCFLFLRLARTFGLLELHGS